MFVPEDFFLNETIEKIYKMIDTDNSNSIKIEELVKIFKANGIEVE